MCAFRLFQKRKRSFFTALHNPEQLEDRQLLSAVVASKSLELMSGMMDEYHRSFDVYTDIGAAGNHFHAYAQLGGAVDMSGDWSENPHRGATAIRAEFEAGRGPLWGGFVMQNGVIPPDLAFPVPEGTTLPLQNWGTVPNAGIDLSGVTHLTFWARGEEAGEQVSFFIGGIGWNPFDDRGPFEPFADSAQRLPHHHSRLPGGCIDARATPEPIEVTDCVQLDDQWRQFQITIPENRPMDYVLGGFAWTVEQEQNPGGAVFFVDDIQYHLNDGTQAARLNEPRFVRSFRTLNRQPDHPIPLNDFDFKLRNIAFTYDNALAALAYLADQNPATRQDSLRRARLIGDAMVSAAKHDRAMDFETHGRLRSAYAGGDYQLPPGWLPNGRGGVPPTPGWFDEQQQMFFEIGQRRFDVGNNAWAMSALIALHRTTGKPTSEYLEVARKLGEFIMRFEQPMEEFGGFGGGEEWPDDQRTEDPDALIPLPWASTEHNIDVVAAFTEMHAVTGEQEWLDAAEHARKFVENMWDNVRGCYLTGTKARGVLNRDVLPLDPQTWSILALDQQPERSARVLNCIDANHALEHAGFQGVDFNEDLDGVWFEGLGQVATAIAVATPFDFANAPEGTAKLESVDEIREELARAARRRDGDGVVGMLASTRDELTTGFDFTYSPRIHVAAESWNVFAQLSFNPYYQTYVPMPGDADDDCDVDFSDFLILAESFGRPIPPGEGPDFDGSGQVDFADFLILSTNFGAGTWDPMPETELADKTISTSAAEGVFAALELEAGGDEEDGELFATM